MSRGQHRSPRRLFSATPEEWERFERCARAHGFRYWTAWARWLMNRASVGAGVGADIRPRVSTDIRVRRRRSA
jgi:hypothetical protein